MTRLRHLRERMVETGRACVHRQYRHGGVVLALWSALAAFMQRNRLDTMVGCASVGMRDGGFISAHDFHIASLIADVVCGGAVEAGSLVTEEYLMALERKHFCSLLEHPKSQERIMGLLQTGKPVRN